MEVVGPEGPLFILFMDLEDAGSHRGQAGLLLRKMTMACAGSHCGSNATDRFTKFWISADGVLIEWLRASYYGRISVDGGYSLFPESAIPTVPPGWGDSPSQRGVRAFVS